jgi:hypothetical protein
MLEAIEKHKEALREEVKNRIGDMLVHMTSFI